jgi:hypothetical protein
VRLIDVNGSMRQREDRPDLLRIAVPDNAESLSVGRIPQAIVDGALLPKRPPGH